MFNKRELGLGKTLMSGHLRSYAGNDSFHPEAKFGQMLLSAIFSRMDAVFLVRELATSVRMNATERHCFEEAISDVECPFARCCLGKIPGGAPFRQAKSCGQAITCNLQRQIQTTN